MTKIKPLVINGWYIFGHTLFLDQVALLCQKHPTNYKRKNATKRLAAILKLAFEVIPQDPTLPMYRQGSTIGDANKHWFRAKFFQQYCIFFRYHLKSKIIVYAWVNDDSAKRAYNSKTDVYRIFKKMLNKGHPPDNWEMLIKEATIEITGQR